MNKSQEIRKLRAAQCVANEDYRGALNELNLGSIADSILKLGEKALHLTPVPDSTDGARSKFGGSPDVPADFIWPCRTDGKPLAFLAQFDCAEVLSFNIENSWPPNGTIAFFYDADQTVWGFDPQDRQYWSVFYFPASVVLEKVAPPGSVGQFYKPCSMRFVPVLTFPDPFSISADYQRPPDAMIDDYVDFLEICRGGSPASQLFGHPLLIQNDWRDECQLVSNGIYCGDGKAYTAVEHEHLLESSGRWCLLLQLDSDEVTGFEWGDGGIIYFAIEQDALESRDLSKAWMILQCF